MKNLKKLSIAKLGKRTKLVIPQASLNKITGGSRFHFRVTIDGEEMSLSPNSNGSGG